jgi:hypothetical protein
MMDLFNILKFEGPKGAIKNKNKQAVNRWRTDNTMDKRKRTNNDLQNTTPKTKDRVKRTVPKTGGEIRCSVSYLHMEGTIGTKWL